jgi:flagellar biosynthesis protein FlhG
MATSAASPDVAAALASPARRSGRDLRQAPPRARVLVVASGKGGVGKTNLAVNLGLRLAMAGRRVLLVDCDLGLANVDLVLGQRPRGDLGHVLAGRMDLDAIIHDGPAGLRWIPGGSHVPDLARTDRPRRTALFDALAREEARHDFVLLDAPAGIGAGVLDLAGQADELVLVTTPEPTSMMDAYTLLKAVAASRAGLPERVRLVVNMVAHRREGARVHRRMAEVAGRFLGVSVDLLGHVFCDGHVGRAVQKQQPFVLAYPHSQASWCVRQLAEGLMEDSADAGGGRAGFFRRIANLLSTGHR